MAKTTIDGGADNEGKGVQPAEAPKRGRAKREPTLRVTRSLTALWLLRLFDSTFARRLVGNYGLLPSGLERSLGVSEREKLPARKWFAEQRRLLEQLGAEADHRAVVNAQLFGTAIGLSDLQTQVLALIATSVFDEGLGSTLKNIQLRSSRDAAKVFGVALNQPEAEVRAALSRPSPLIALDLVSFQAQSYDPPFALVTPLAELFGREYNDADELMGAIYERPEPTRLTLDAFPHLARDTDIAVRYLDGALRGRMRGINVLLHGPGGSGKTELAKVLAAMLGLELYSVAVASEQGEALDGAARRGAYAIAQRALRGRERRLLLFDEFEETVNEPRWFGGPNPLKGWLNRALETNSVPTLWITNQLDRLDPAVLRRFDLIVEVPAPPASVRHAMLSHHAGEMSVDDAWLRQAAMDARTTPGHVERAAKVAKFVRASAESALPDHTSHPKNATSEGIMSHVLDASLRASVGERRASLALPEDYDLSYLNADRDLEGLVRGLQRTGHANLCLSGPPGTGKTMFAQHIARTLDRPIETQGTSSLLGPYLGQTEKAIADMFRRAQSTGAVLLLDEADSFLRSRERARQSWEVTQVNELLMQMEHFDGIFICATNSQDTLDSALARRFTAEVHFRAMREEQARRMLARLLAEMGARSGEALAETRDAELAGLTPGHFAAVRRRLELEAGEVTVARVIEELRVQRGAEGRGGKRIGFG